MSTSAIVPVSSSTYSVDFTSPSATAGQLSVFNSILGQLQTAISGGDLTSAQTLYSALSALSPTSVTDSNVQGTFLTNVGQALTDGSVAEAQTALAAFQSATPATTTPAASTTATTTATASNIATNLIQSQIQLNLVQSLLGPSSTLGSAASSTLSTTDQNSLTSILNAAYGTSGSTNTTASSATSSSSSATTSASATGATATTPYDTLVNSIQASLAAGDGTITPALAYLQASGNFVNTTA